YNYDYDIKSLIRLIKLGSIYDEEPNALISNLQDIEAIAAVSQRRFEHAR
ncbi:12003_t:CDS:2, partial [Funneliformis geosporum]